MILKKLNLSNKNVVGYLFLLPLILGVLTFSLYPIIEAFRISLYHHNGVRGVWAGLSNYDFILHDSTFWRALRNTFMMGIMGLGIGLPLSFIVASLVNSIVRPGMSMLFKAIYFLPNVTSTIAASIVFMLLFYPTEKGIANSLLNVFGLEPLGWLSDPRYAQISVILMDTWHGLGYSVLIWLAGLQSISRDLYEAAEVDGAKKLQQWLYITIPSMKPVIFFMVVMGTINAFKRFGEVFVIGGPDGNPGGSLFTLMLYVYRYGFYTFDFGKAAAASYIIFIIILVFTLLNFTAFKNKD
ncbi:carbohydrate ABC transporter permease [Paenibacillus mendelii]|uniref:Carbohydrate ABC transporter permease n=1 Tax=Paenibacillus mendelii TaxID=206163 RepID=A0ABV6JC72_9BACL|nr:sugar ABC transporter permease [Paenibacillus mendelii]MCQ6561510.1 sugar ABC transporter permease [Paenibacillus mendelii]